MFCPNCSAEIEGVKYCRSCGANVSLIPQALTGQLPVAEEPWTPGRRRRRSRNAPPTLEGAISRMFTGIAFLACALAVWRFFPGGSLWWFWMLIPGFATLGEGIGKFIRIRNEQRAPGPPALPQQPPAVAQVKGVTTSSLEEPPQDPSSIVEHTTYHLKK